MASPVKGKSRALALMNEAKVTKRLNFFKHCTGRAVVLGIKEYAPEDDPIPRFRVDLKILSAKAQGDSFGRLEERTVNGKKTFVWKRQGAPAIEPHAEGEVINFICKLQKKTYGPQNAKAFVLALFGAEDDDSEEGKAVYEETYMELIGHEFDKEKNEWIEKGLNPGRGMVIDFKSWWKQRKDPVTKQPLDDEWMSNTDFIAVEQSDEDVAKMAASLGEEEPADDEVAE